MVPRYTIFGLAKNVRNYVTVSPTSSLLLFPAEVIAEISTPINLALAGPIAPARPAWGLATFRRKNSGAKLLI
jgi:hypothetical protein